MPHTQTQSPTPVKETPSQMDVNTEEKEEGIFQAIGIITGEVTIDPDGKENTIKIGNKIYPLLYIPQKIRAFEGLKKEIQNTGKKIQRLVVYPKVIHFPGRDNPHKISFQVVGFDTGKVGNSVSEELQDMEFKFAGFWQFIPVCQTPCVSIFRNFSTSRINYIKKIEPFKKVKFMKASHLPLLWRDSVVRPFRFDPKAGKEQQGHPTFVTVKAKFLPDRDLFGFLSLLSPPQDTPPRFLKASKKDKATVLHQSNKNKPPTATAKKSKPVAPVVVKSNSSTTPIPKPVKKVK